MHHSSLQRRVSRGALTLSVAALSLIVLGGPVRATTLPQCSSLFKGRVVPVGAEVRAAVTKYYAVKHLTPVVFYKNRETIINVTWQWPGVRHCTNPGGGTGSYVGHVPKNATAAVWLMVTHRPYPVVQSTTHFVVVARVPSSGWRVVSEGTGL